MIIPPLTFTFLGTGTSAGVPMIGCNCEVCQSDNNKDRRLRSSLLVQSNTTTIVVDTTPDFRYQMLRQKNTKLDAVIYTHSHKDHIAGLDDVRAYNYFQQQAMPIYATPFTQGIIKQEFAYCFSNSKYPGIPELQLINMPNNLFYIGNIPVTPINLLHHKMPVLGFRFGKFVYITDANYISEAEKEKILGADVLVLNALRKEQHISHFTLQQAVDLAIEVAVPEVYFTHISHQLGLHNAINSQLPHHIQLAHDGLSVSI